MFFTLKGQQNTYSKAIVSAKRPRTYQNVKNLSKTVYEDDDDEEDAGLHLKRIKNRKKRRDQYPHCSRVLLVQSNLAKQKVVEDDLVYDVETPCV